MVDSLVVTAGIFLAALFVFAMSRRQDHAVAVGVLDRQARRRDRGVSRYSAEPISSGRELERRAALERRSASPPALSPTPAPPVPIDEETLGVTRRQFLNRSILAVFGLSVAGFGSAVVGFLWPTLSGGFGSKISAGSLSNVKAKLTATSAPVYVPEARSYLNPYPLIDVGKAKGSGAYADPILAGMEFGLVALYQKCPHLGCRVPWCQSSQWFECPCHGSQYNRVGEKKGGPAPRGMDRFAATLSHGEVIIDTKTVFLGPPIGTNTTGQEAEGPHCR